MVPLAAILIAASMSSETKGIVGELTITGRTQPIISSVVDVQDLGNGIRFARWDFRHYHVPGNPPNESGSAIIDGPGVLAFDPFLGLVLPQTAVAIYIEGDPNAIFVARK